MLICEYHWYSSLLEKDLPGTLKLTANASENRGPPGSLEMNRTWKPPFLGAKMLVSGGVTYKYVIHNLLEAISDHTVIVEKTQNVNAFPFQQKKSEHTY